MLLMRLISQIFSFVIIVLILLVFFVNISNTITLETSFISLKANVGFLILSCSILSSLATLLFLISKGWFLNSDINKLKRQHEKSKLNHELESDKVKQLEAKINTLEEALKAVTQKK